tara:strand:- start:1098 stop:1487 length:390 start_codon:yes stop_codon:yes gene_type:complete
MKKTDLELKIAGLEKAIATCKDETNGYENDLKSTKKLLDDYNKPELTPQQMDSIHEVVENVVNDFDFEDTDNYNIEYELDYDGRVNANSLEFQSSYELVEKIVDKLHNLFKEADCPEDELEANSSFGND